MEESDKSRAESGILSLSLASRIAKTTDNPYHRSVERSISTLLDTSRKSGNLNTFGENECAFTVILEKF